MLNRFVTNFLIPLHFLRNSFILFAQIPVLSLWQFNSAEFRFFVAGSKLNLFKIFQGRADFQKLRDDQFYYDSCIWVSQIVNGTTTVRAFNEIAGRATNIRFARHGLLTLNYTTEPIQTILGLEHTITLTDNKTYVFFSTCWTGTNERGWFTYSTKDLWNNEQWRKMIGEHAVSLGFNRRNFAFMKRTNCVEFPDY